MFKKFFKPKWQHANPSVRLEALSRLKTTDADDRKIIAQLGKNDPAIEVRIGAVALLPDKASLTSLLLQEREPQVRMAIVDQLLGLSNAEQQLDSAMSDLILSMDMPLWVKVATETKHLELGLLAIEQIDDQEILTAQALQLPLAALRQKAAARVEVVPHLETIEKAAKGKDKAVFRIARNKLQAMREAEKREASLEQQTEQLCLSMEQLARNPDDPQFQSRVEHLQKVWNSLQMHASSDDAQRYQRALAICRQALQENAAIVDQQHVSQQLQIESQQERMAACEQLEAAVAQIQAESIMAINGQDLSAFNAILKTQHNRWQTAAEDSAPAQDELRRFARAREQLEKLLSALQTFQQQQSNWQQLSAKVAQLEDPAQPQVSSLQRRLDQALLHIAWPEALAEPAELQQLRRDKLRLRELADQIAEKQARAEEQLKAVLAKLDEAITQGQLKQANKLFADAQQWQKYLPEQRAAVMQTEVRSYGARVSELRDWQGFAITPKKEQLCAEMESLISADMDPQERANRIKRLQDDWKALGYSREDQPLWERFSEAADKAYDLCRDYFNNLSALRAENLHKRQRLIDQLDEYLEKYDFAQADWKAVQDIYETAKQEWRLYSPVERKQSKLLQTQFNKLLDRLHELLAQQWQQNRQQREALIAAAEALLTESDIGKAISSSKQLQRQWKDTGPVARRDGNRLWRKFRGLNDQIFARRDTEREAKAVQLQNNQAEADHLIELIERLADTQLSAGEKTQEFQQLQRRFQALDGFSKAAYQKIQQRYKHVCQGFQQQLQNLRLGERKQQLTALWQTLLKYDELEADWLQQPESPLPELVEAESAFADFPLARQVLKNRLQVLQGLAQEPGAASSRDNEDKLRELCLRLEILTGVASPEGDQEQRMQLQVARLEDGLQQREQSHSLQEEVEQLLVAWSRVGAVTPEQRSQFSRRFAAGLHQAGLLSS